MDQKAKFTPRGIVTEFVGEAQEDQVAIKNVLQGKVQLVFISPEALLHNRAYRSMLLRDTYKQHLVTLAVDEAHCVKIWSVYKLYIYIYIYIMHNIILEASS